MSDHWASAEQGCPRWRAHDFSTVMTVAMYACFQANDASRSDPLAPLDCWVAMRAIAVWQCPPLPNLAEDLPHRLAREPLVPEMGDPWLAAHALQSGSAERNIAMKVAIPSFGARVSPRFDCAQSFLLVMLHQGAPSEREQLSAADWTPYDRINKMVELGVDTVVCGGIDCWSAESLESAGITLYAHAAGEIEDVLPALLRGELHSESPTNADRPDASRSLPRDDDVVSWAIGAPRGVRRQDEREGVPFHDG